MIVYKDEISCYTMPQEGYTKETVISNLRLGFAFLTESMAQKWYAQCYFYVGPF